MDLQQSTRPNAFRHVLYDRGVRFAVGLAVVVAIPVAVLFYFQFRSLNDLEATSAVVLRQLSTDTADSLSREIDEALKGPHIRILLATPQARLEPLDFAFMNSIFADGLAESPFIEELFVWSELAGAGRAEKVFVFNRASLDMWNAAVEERFRASPARTAQLVPMLREMVDLRRAIVAFTDHELSRLHSRCRAPQDHVLPKPARAATINGATVRRIPRPRDVPRGWREQARDSTRCAADVHDIRRRAHVSIGVL
jgi:hypothetical protein